MDCRVGGIACDPTVCALRSGPQRLSFNPCFAAGFLPAYQPITLLPAPLSPLQLLEKGRLAADASPLAAAAAALAAVKVDVRKLNVQVSRITTEEECCPGGQ